MKNFKEYLQERKMLATLATIGGIASSSLAQNTEHEQLIRTAVASIADPDSVQIAADHIKQFEDFHDTAHSGDQGEMKIGYGMKKYPSGKQIKQGDTVTQDEAHNHLLSHIGVNIIPKLWEKIPDWKKMDAHKQAALISFAHSHGTDFYGKKGFESLTNHLRNRNWDQVDDAIQTHNTINGQVNDRLTGRRQAEAVLWNKSTTAEAPAQTTQTDSTDGVTHTVEEGDDIEKIAKRYNMSVEELVGKNPKLERNRNYIKVGDKITITHPKVQVKARAHQILNRYREEKHNR